MGYVVASGTRQLPPDGVIYLADGTRVGFCNLVEFAILYYRGGLYYVVSEMHIPPEYINLAIVNPTWLASNKIALIMNGQIVFDPDETNRNLVPVA